MIGPGTTSREQTYHINPAHSSIRRIMLRYQTLRSFCSDHNISRCTKLWGRKMVTADDCEYIVCFNVATWCKAVESLLEASRRHLILLESMMMAIYHAKIMIIATQVKPSCKTLRHISWLEDPQIKLDNPSLKRNIGDICLIIPFEYLSRRSFAEPGKMPRTHMTAHQQQLKTWWGSWMSVQLCPASPFGMQDTRLRSA